MKRQHSTKWFLFIVLSLFSYSAFAETGTESTSSTADTNTSSPSSETAPAVEGTISRSLFTSAVQDHEPIDQLTVLSELISEAFYFTEFRNFQGHTLTHQWSHNGKISHSISFAINAKRWRVHSSKTFHPNIGQEGTWTVKVLDEEGNVLREDSIDYIRPSTDEEIAAAQKEIEAEKQKQQAEAEQSASDSQDSNNTEPEADTSKAEDATKDKASDTSNDSGSEADKAKESDSETDKSDEATDSKADKPEDTANSETDKSKETTDSEADKSSETTDSETDKSEDTADSKADKSKDKPIWEKL